MLLYSHRRSHEGIRADERQHRNTTHDSYMFHATFPRHFTAILKVQSNGSIGALLRSSLIVEQPVRIRVDRVVRDVELVRTIAQLW